MKRTLVFVFLVFACTPASGWHDETHLAVAKAAGYAKWYNAAGPDVAKTKSWEAEGYNHYFDNPENGEVTAEMVMEQVPRYNDPRDKDGHLYGAIIASLRAYATSTMQKKYAANHLAYCVHYVADLSQPLHNIAYDSFNRERHEANDATVEGEVLENLHRIREHMYPLELGHGKFEEELSKEIARIAELSRKLGLKLRSENRDMTRQEAYQQLGHSASLFKAILEYLETQKKAGEGQARSGAGPSRN